LRDASLASGSGARGAFHTLTPEQWIATEALNSGSVFHSFQAAVPIISYVAAAS
jgi:hypothetical protein